MKISLLSTALLVASLAACQPQADPVDDAVDAIVDQPAADVPPATAPRRARYAGDASTPETGQARYDGYGDMRFGMSAKPPDRLGRRADAPGGEADPAITSRPSGGGARDSPPDRERQVRRTGWVPTRKRRQAVARSE